MMKIMEMHAQNVICGPQKKKIRKKIIFSQVINKKPKKYTELTPGDPNCLEITQPWSSLSSSIY